MAERLQKFLAKSGIGSRRYCEELIKSKKIKVNGQIALIGSSVNKNDEVEYDGNIISFTESEIRLLMLNKPEGVLSSNKKEKNIPIVFDFLPEGKSKIRWISIGRLDINSSGLMLFTNDGTFANYCMHPSSSIDREYLVRARGDFTKEKKEKMLSGIKIDNDIYRFTDIVEGEKQSSNQWFSVCLMSGKNREVRKIFNAVGLEISRLKRTRFGPIFLPSSLKKGGYIELSSKEIDSIKNYGI
ncbi:rRNA pseudouridine synthase [Gammaproteobacteria bacterium]|jgi:23S rRNA pseudouridine2605 synthase|nr:rRNA pseudouridine synthase [Gammaproteobacteria bacterium]|tara:strand:+ start:8712 stop:9437 length:726 start_codon:yes stop_codon:yes gene_type:complete